MYVLEQFWHGCRPEKSKYMMTWFALGFRFSHTFGCHAGRSRERYNWQGRRCGWEHGDREIALVPEKQNILKKCRSIGSGFSRTPRGLFGSIGSMAAHSWSVGAHDFEAPVGA
jgi:hypothetical protein